MKSLLVVAQNTFRETVRDKILYNLVFFALLLIGCLGPARDTDHWRAVPNRQRRGVGRHKPRRGDHRHLRGHRSGVQGDRTAHDLYDPRQADHQNAIYSREILRAGCVIGGRTSPSC